MFNKKSKNNLKQLIFIYISIFWTWQPLQFWVIKPYWKYCLWSSTVQDNAELMKCTQCNCLQRWCSKRAGVLWWFLRGGGVCSWKLSHGRISAWLWVSHQPKLKSAAITAKPWLSPDRFQGQKIKAGTRVWPVLLETQNIIDTIRTVRYIRSNKKLFAMLQSVLG